MGTCIEYTADTERWLDDVWCVLADVLYSCALLAGDQLLGDLDLAIANTGHVDDDLALLLEV